MSRVHVEGQGTFTDADALKKIQEHELQIEGFDRTIREHEKGIEECKRQREEVRKLLEPIRKAMIRRLGGGS